MTKLLNFVFGAFACMFVMFGTMGAANAIDYPFSVTTTELEPGDTVSFSLAVQGTFYVDCGSGGVLSGTGVSGQTIDHTSNANAVTYTCTYASSGGEKTIRFGKEGSLARGVYNGSSTVATISFASNDKIAALNGNLSTLFPLYDGVRASNYPHYYQTFYQCTALESIPSTLFSNYSGANYTNMFYGTFQGCTALTSIPAGLFQTTSPMGTTFYDTFNGCTALTSIPSGLFPYINNTFGNQNFYQMFKGCTNLRTVPSDLFSGLRYVGSMDFAGTFEDCTSLESLPDELFANIETASTSSFYRTFKGCSGLTGYIPAKLFNGLIANGSPYPSGMMNDIFGGAINLRTTCPTGTRQYITGYETYWDSHVSCVNEYTCSNGRYLPANSTQCAACQSGNNCPGGTYGFNPFYDQGTTYSEDPGKYLQNVNGVIHQHVTCPAGSYCPGFQNVEFSGGNIGIYNCTDTDPSYTDSDEGSFAFEQCFYWGSDECRNINMYPQDNNPDLHSDPEDWEGSTYHYNNDYPSTRIYSFGNIVTDDVADCAVSDINCDAIGIPSGRMKANGDLANYLFQSMYVAWDSPDIKFRDVNGYFGHNDAGMADGEWEITWRDGTVMRGAAACHNDLPGIGTPFSPDSMSAGEHSGNSCFCKLTGYALNGGAMQSTEGFWVMYADESDPDHMCASNCAFDCLYFVSGVDDTWDPQNREMRKTLFGDAGYVSDTCESTINVTWYDRSSEYASDMCEYGSTISMPSAPTRTGYTFNGWNIAW